EPLRLALDSRPLSKEQKLQELLVRDLLRQLRPRLRERSGLAPRESPGPARPGASPRGLDRRKESPVGEPRARRGGIAEGGELGPQAPVGGKPLPRPAEELLLPVPRSTEIRDAAGRDRTLFEIAGRTETLFHHALRRDQERISGERGSSAIGR